MTQFYFIIKNIYLKKQNEASLKKLKLTIDEKKFYEKKKQIKS